MMQIAQVEKVPTMRIGRWAWWMVLFSVAVLMVWAPTASAWQTKPDDNRSRRGGSGQATTDRNRPESAVQAGSASSMRRISEWSRMSPAERDELESFIGQYFPEVWQELSDLSLRGLEIYDRRMEPLAHELVPLIDQLEDKPERTRLVIKEKQLEYQIRQLVSEYLLTPDPKKRAKLHQKVTKLVADQFDVMQKRRTHELERLESRVRELRRLFEEKNKNRDDLIRRRVEARLDPAGRASGSSNTGKSNPPPSDRKGASKGGASKGTSKGGSSESD